MKSRAYQRFFLSTLIILSASVAALAQDAGMSDTEIIDSRGAGGGDLDFTPGEEGRYIPRAAGVMLPQDSITLQMHDFPMLRAAQKPADKTSEKQGGKQKDDSVLTYNFLYYIIQKYKLQDIID